MNVHYATEALATLLTSQANLEVELGRHAFDVMLCISVLGAFSHLAELRLLVLNSVNLSRGTDGVWTIGVTSNGIGVQLRLVDEDLRPLTTLPGDEQVFDVEVTDLLGVATPAHGGDVR